MTLALHVSQPYRCTDSHAFTERQRQIVHRETAEVFGSDAVVRLFGSRMDDQARGGGLDLLIESNVIIPDQRRKSLQLAARLQLQLGDQPIDVLIVDPTTNIQPVHEQALRTGICL